MKRRFKFHITANGEEVGSEGIIEVDQTVIDYAKSDEYKESFHTFHTDNDIAAHLAYNFVVNREDLSSLEGFMMDTSLAKITKYPYDWNDFGVDAEEIVDDKAE